MKATTVSLAHMFLDRLKGTRLKDPTRSDWLKLAVLAVLAALTITLFALGQDAAAVVSVLTNLGLVVGGLWGAPPNRPQPQPQPGDSQKGPE
ncbi:hypothetical protein LUZ16_28885 [Streptomyces albireticuli]|nr:hypothetical protein [Streptomyces albireticuli]